MLEVPFILFYNHPSTLCHDGDSLHVGDLAIYVDKDDPTKINESHITALAIISHDVRGEFKFKTEKDSNDWLDGDDLIDFETPLGPMEFGHSAPSALANARTNLKLRI